MSHLPRYSQTPTNFSSRSPDRTSEAYPSRSSQRDDGTTSPYAGTGSRGSRLTMASVDEASRYRAMIKYLHGKIVSLQWFERLKTSQPHGVLLRKSRGHYVTEPSDIDPLLLQAVAKINVEVAFTMATETTHVIFQLLKPDEATMLLPNGAQLQIIDSLAEIARSGSSLVKKFQYGALIRDEQILLVWHDDLDKILLQASSIEEKLLGLIWGTGASPFGLPTTSTAALQSPGGSIYGFNNESKTAFQDVKEAPSPPNEMDEEKNDTKESLARPLVFTSSVVSGLGIFFVFVLFFGMETSHVLYESFYDGSYLRCALLALNPVLMTLSVFFCICVVGNLFQLVGPVTGLKQNSRYFSSIKPSVKHAYDLGFRPPPITIQMPVYMESLEGVIKPTVRSLKAAISYYESRGGSASIFVNDDGLLSGKAEMTEEQIQARMDFYHDSNIGWVARPKHSKDGFERQGKFKKASNMNFGLNVSCKVERILQNLVEEATHQEKGMGAWIDGVEEEQMYQKALDYVLLTDQEHRWMASGNIRMGEIILIVDSDTQVPEDCLLYGAAEMFLSPEVAIIQHSTGVMQVSWDYFENGITFFTNLVYSAIRFAVGNGEVAPFVGHNAFLRWEAVQSIADIRPDGYVAFWSEDTVSEDFAMALQLQATGNIVRLATYHSDEFKEGVSLTIYDELARWEKYAYGCNELVFHPLYCWLWRGPFTKIFRSFLRSNMHLSSKVTILGYVSSYYAIASSFPLTILNYFLVGWFNGYLDKFYLQSWNIFLSVVLVFNIIGNICLAIVRYRLGEKGLWASLIENFKWMPMFAIFFGGLSFHINLAILAHMFCFNMQWGATAKEKENSNFFKEVPKIARSFKWMYLTIIPLVGGMIYLGVYAPYGWEITDVTAIVPLAVMICSHALLPFVLNPSIMIFNY